MFQKRNKKIPMPPVFAAIVWKPIFDRVTMPDDMLREIKVYKHGSLDYVEEFSGSAIGRLLEKNIPIKDDSKKFPEWMVGKRFMGEVDWR